MNKDDDCIDAGNYKPQAATAANNAQTTQTQFVIKDCGELGRAAFIAVRSKPPRAATHQPFKAFAVTEPSGKNTDTSYTSSTLSIPKNIRT